MARKSDEQTRLDNWEALQRELRPGETVLDRMAFLRWLQSGPWTHSGFTRNQDGEIVVGMFFPKVPNHGAGTPEQRKLESDWEQRSIAMHDAQTTIKLEDKPVERKRMRSDSAVAAFETKYADAPVPNFEDSPGATGKHRTTKRSD